MGVLALLVFLILLPCIIGLAGAKLISLRGITIWIAAIPMGFFLEMGLFQLVAFPWAMLNLSFSSLCITFICILCICGLFAFLYCRKKDNIPTIRFSFSAREWVYGIMAFLLIGWQLYNMITLDIGYWSSDDATYGAIANDTLTYNHILRNNFYTGIAITLNIQRAIQTSLFFPAFLSFVSGFSTVFVFHTVLGVYYLFLAYIVYTLLGKILFKSIENVFVFLVLLSVLYVFGLYTIYSQTYRLLGPNTQGKAVLAVSFFPFLYALLIKVLPNEYNRRFGIILMLLSAAATGMTLFGAVTIVGNVVFPVVASLIGKKRNWKNLRYIFWGSILPVIYGGIYFYCRFVP